MRIQEAGDAALVLQLEPIIDDHINAKAIAIAAALRRQRLTGVRDIISTFASVAVHFNPLTTDVRAVLVALEQTAAVAATEPSGRSIEIPMRYGGRDGPDLEAVAAWAGLPVDEVIARHSDAEYRVYMLGFLPGFAYMGIVDAAIAAPRHATPRVRVPAGSIGIAGSQTGIYPRASPGGWQIIGHTATRVFDPEREQPTLFRPGDRVRFVPITRSGARPNAAEPPPSSGGTQSVRSERQVTVLHPGLFTTVQDAGRWGYQAEGVPVAGAMDRVSHRVANAIVGNEQDAAALEFTLAGPELRFEQPTNIVLAGADVTPTVNGSAVPLRTLIACDTGSVLRFGERRAGARGYVAFDGGIAVPLVLGSRSTHTLTGLGGMHGRPLRQGDVLPLGARMVVAPRRRVAADPLPQDGATLRVLPGPHHQFFAADALEALTHSRFTIAAQSDRMAYRLTADRPIPRVTAGEMISDAMVTGGIQIPASGTPLLLMADRQTTGGYPLIATVITADLPVAAQLSPGNWIEFTVCSRSEAIRALLAQEGRLLAIG